MKTAIDLPLAALLALLMALPVLTTGCTEEQKVKMQTAADTRRRAESQRVVKERALEYWDAVRWQNWSMAAIYFQEAEDQKRYLQMQTRLDAKHPAIDEVEIAYVFVDPETFESGEVRVQWNTVAAKEAKVVEEQHTQRWYKDGGRWWIDPEGSLLETAEAGAGATSSAPVTPNKPAPAATDAATTPPPETP